MGNMKFKSQICTTREQSERLLALGLSANTADMSYYIDEMYGSYNSYLHPHPPTIKGTVPAWSLHRLIEIMYAGDMYSFLGIRVGEDNVNILYEDVITHIAKLIDIGHFDKNYLEDKK